MKQNVGKNQMSTVRCFWRVWQQTIDHSLSTCRP